MISEKIFKTALNGMWYTFVNAAGLIDRLEGLGLAVTEGPSETSACMGGFGCLIGMQVRAEASIMELLGIDLRAGGSAEGAYLSDELDQYLRDIRTMYPDCSITDTFPEECYEGLLDIIRNAGITIPWERKEV